MRVFVTGCAGFIGSNLIDRLLGLGHEIIGIDNFDSFYNKLIKYSNIENALKNPQFHFMEGDIRDVSFLESCFKHEIIDLVIHLAAKAGVRPSIFNPQSYYDINVIGTLNILECMKAFSVNKMLFASSSSVYGNNHIIPFSETDNVDSPISPYAATKKAGELLCHTYHYLYQFDIFCLRFFTVYGPRQRPDLAIHKFTNQIIQNQTIEIYGDGKTSRDYTYINDIIDGIVKAKEHLKGFNIINLGESKTIDLNTMIEVLENQLGKKAAKKYWPNQLGDVDITFANISKAKEILGYNPSWTIEDGIRAFVKWKLSEKQ